MPYESTSCCGATSLTGAASSEASEDREVEDGDDRGLSIGEMLVEVVGVESAVARRRRAVSEGRAVVVMAMSRGRIRRLLGL